MEKPVLVPRRSDDESHEGQSGTGYGESDAAGKTRGAGGEMKIAQDGGAILFFHDKVKELHDGIEVFCGGGDSEV